MAKMMTKTKITIHILSKYKPLILKHAPLEGKTEAKSKTLSQILEKY